MKLTKRFGLNILAGSLLLVSLTAADKASTKGANSKNSDNAVYTFVDAEDPALADVAQLGYKTIDQVGGQLISEVNRELATKETSLAVSVLHLKRYELPKPVAGQPTVTAVKRTSFLIRNPLNAPDRGDEAALEKVHKQLLSNQEVSSLLLQKVERPGKEVEYRAYRPIASAQTCLECHGDTATFKPGVKKALDEQYPQDQAVDYAAKEWRGLLRVSIAPAKK